MSPPLHRSPLGMQEGLIPHETVRGTGSVEKTEGEQAVCGKERKEKGSHFWWQL